MTERTTSLCRQVRWALFGAGLLSLAIATSATAQTPPPPPPQRPAGQTPPPGQAPRRPGRPFDLSMGAAVTGPIQFGSRAAQLIRPDGSLQTLFQTENRLGTGLGLEAHLGVSITPTVWAEATGTWSAADFETRISSDFENAPATVATEGLDRFSVEGAVRWDVWKRGRTAVFARGGYGWVRELAGEGALVRDGAVASAGLGLRHWWRERRAGLRTRRIGVRVDGRINVQSTGLTLGENKRRLSPVLFGGVIFGF